jgi:prolyl oligopeptidase
VLLAALAAVTFAAPAPPTYPETRRDEVVDDYFGTRVPDPYRWLEDDRSPETAAWVAAQNAVTERFLAAIPARAAIRRRLTALWDVERVGAPVRRGGRYFYTRNAGLEPQAALWVTDRLGSRGRLLLDPGALSKDGTVALSAWVPSEDGRLVAWAAADGGSDWQTWRVREVATGKDLPDELRWTKFTAAAWARDGSGFWYGRYDAPAEGAELTAVNKHQKLFFHRLGTAQAEDRLAFARDDQPDWSFAADVSEDGRWLLVYQFEGTRPENRVLLRDLADPAGGVAPWLDGFDGAYAVVGSDGETFYVRTDHGAPRGRLVAIDRAHPEPAAWRTLVPEGAGREVMDEVGMVGDRFWMVWQVDAASRLRTYRLDGTLEREVALPALGTAAGLSARRADPEGFLAFTSFTEPTTAHRYRAATGRLEPWRAPRLRFDPSRYQAEQVFYASRDGTRIPMFLVHRRGLVRDGRAPTYLYGYGGFNVSMGPAFSPSIIAWLELGGVYAQPCLRGGGEYGREWHDAGRLERRQNVFDDVIAAAEWLVAGKVTSPSRLAIGGGSNGGLLVGAAMTQRPDLFAAALPAVGVLDMLRFHRFTIGWAWTSDYGSSETREGFETLHAYSPLHRLVPGTRYPATLVTTGDHDDRVVPAHSFKFTAALQAAQAPGGPPVLARIETRGGHGAGKPTRMAIEERADQWAFLVAVLGMEGTPAR